MARRNPFATQQRIITWQPPAEREAPPNLPAAADALYQVVRKLVSNDGRMTTEDYAAAIAALRLAQQPQ